MKNAAPWVALLVLLGGCYRVPGPDVAARLLFVRGFCDSRMSYVGRAHMLGPDSAVVEGCGYRVLYTCPYSETYGRVCTHRIL
jgi:hypothetical protein